MPNYLEVYGYTYEWMTGRFVSWNGDPDETHFFTDPLPQTADLFSLVRVLHDHNDDEAMLLLRNIRRAMQPGSTLLIAEPMAEAAGAHAVGDAYFAFYLLAMGRGRARSAHEISAMLNQAGFNRIRQIQTNTPVITQLIEARG